MNNFGILTVITCPALVDSGCGKRPKITRVEIADEVAKRFQTLDIRFENLRIAFDRSVLSTNKSYFKLDLRIFAIATDRRTDCRQCLASRRISRVTVLGRGVGRLPFQRLPFQCNDLAIAPSGMAIQPDA